MPNELPKKLNDVNTLLRDRQQLFATLQQLQAMREDLSVFDHNH